MKPKIRLRWCKPCWKDLNVVHAKVNCQSLVIHHMKKARTNFIGVDWVSQCGSWSIPEV